MKTTKKRKVLMAVKKRADPLARATSNRVRLRLTFTVILPEPHQGIPPGISILTSRINTAANAVMCQAGMSERELNECHIEAGARMEIAQTYERKKK